MAMQSTLKASAGGKPKDLKKEECEWSSCQKEHPFEIKYPKGGKVTKGGYRDAWVGAGMCPWDYDGGFKRTRLWKNGKPHPNQANYRFQAHHLIPSTVLKGKSTLKHNIELIGWDVDCNENGMILPWYAIDQPLNELPQHLGNHPAAYYDPVQKVVDQIEEDYDGICYLDMTGEMGPQAALIGELHALANKAKQMILKTRNKTGDHWPLRSDSRKSYHGAMQEYEKREKL
jgi:hypothetical protein